MNISIIPNLITISLRTDLPDTYLHTILVLKDTHYVTVEVIPWRENQACDKKLTESQNKNNTPSSPRGRRWEDE